MASMFIPYFPDFTDLALTHKIIIIEENTFNKETFCTDVILNKYLFFVHR